MKPFIHKKLYSLAEKLNKPLYLVGGVVRNFLINGETFGDIDIASPVLASEFSSVAKAVGFSIDAVYDRTGTALISCGKFKAEFTSFRSEVYPIGGAHTPICTKHTEDIYKDAKRRDFKCNAVYYDIVGEKFIDPLGGIYDIEKKLLSCADGEKTFESDGLRLMRLARFSGELNFTPTKETLEIAKRFNKNVLDISAERIFDELKKILSSDRKYAFSNKVGHYQGLKILSEIGVLDNLFPELALGKGMKQRADFHKHDVLEHILRSVMYAEPCVRLGALCHDVGKPYCMKNFGEYTNHADIGANIAKDILTRLKADKKSINEVCFLVGSHMKDLKCDMSENKVRKFIVDNYGYFDKLLYLKQADFSASMDDLSVAPTVKKWREIYEKMTKDGTPFKISDLKIDAKALMDLGFFGKEIGLELERLMDKCIYDPSLNEGDVLLKIAKKDAENLKIDK